MINIWAGYQMSKGEEKLKKKVYNNTIFPACRLIDPTVLYLHCMAENVDCNWHMCPIVNKPKKACNDD
jgi:hypothetical protein